MTLDELLAAARIEDPDVRLGPAADAFWAAVLTELYRFFASRMDRCDADDLVQLSVDVVLRKLGDFQLREHDSFVRWLRVIAAHQRRAWNRAPQRERVRLAKLAQSSATPLLSPPSWALLCERGGLLDEHKQRLPEHELRALEHELSGGDDRSLAQREGVAVATVRSRRWRARAHVARSIEADRRTPC